MLLAIDIGNTNITLGVYHNNHWFKDWRIQTIKNRMPDEYGIILQQLLSQAGLAFSDLTQAIISSVVPPLTQGFVDLLSNQLQVRPLLLTPQAAHGLILKTNPPENTGADLIANAIAAYEICQSNCLVIDFGTATTITAIEAPGILLGGVIAAGLKTTAQALAQATSQLPSIELKLPQETIGTTTISAMQSGLVLGHLCLIEGLIHRLKKELPEAKVFATGGHSTILCQEQNFIDQVVPMLTLDGLRIAAKRLS
jgi:type III pantothenate kinase